jgi:hypothetical protein
LKTGMASTNMSPRDRSAPSSATSTRKDTSPKSPDTVTRSSRHSAEAPPAANAPASASLTSASLTAGPA